MNRKIWIRIICVALCMAVMLPCVSALGETAKVAAYLLRLREKASTSGKVLDAFPRGTRVTVLKKGDTWTRVRVSGKEGYMMTSYLSIGKKKTEDSGKQKDSGNDKPMESSGTTAYVVKGVRLNLRAEANASCEILGSYRGGTKVTILKKGKYWSRVEVNGLVGYMGSSYLTTDKD